MNAVKISDHFPIIDAEDNYVINSNMDICFGFELRLKQIFSLGKDAMVDENENIVNLLKSLPINSHFHFQSFYYTDKYKSKFNGNENYTAKSNLNYINGKPVIKNYNNAYITLGAQHVVPSAANSPFLRAFDFFKRKSKLNSIKKLIKNAPTTIQGFRDGFSNIPSLSVKMMDSDKLLNSIYDYFTLNYQNPTTKTGKLPDVEFDKGYFKIGGQYVQVLTLAQEPNVLNVAKNAISSPAESFSNGIEFSNNINSLASMLYPIGMGLPIDHILNVGIEIVDPADMIKEVEKQSWELTILKLVDSGAKRKYSDLGFNDDSENVNAYGYKHKIVSDFKPARLSVNVVVHDGSIDGLRDKVKMVQIASKNIHGLKLFEENFENGNLFFCSGPGSMKMNYKFMLSAVEHASMYLPLETTYFNDKDGFIYMDRVYGNPVSLNLWDNPILNGRNGVIFGPTGSGKSFWLNGFVDKALAQGIHVILIDKGGSFKKNVALNNEKYGSCKYFDASTITTNPFLCDQDKHGNYLYEVVEDQDEGESAGSYQVTYVFTLVKKIWKDKNPITSEETALIKKSIEQYYDYVNANKLFPDFTGYWNFLPTFRESLEKKYEQYLDFDSLIMLLEPFAVGKKKKILNSQENIQLKDYMQIAFDLENIDPDLSDIIGMIIINLIIDKVEKLPLQVKKLVINDEFIDFLIGDVGDYVAAAYRKIRKRNGAMYISTQDVSFLDAAPELVKNSILRNLDIKVLLGIDKEKKGTVKDIMRLLEFSEHDIELLNSCQRGKFNEVYYRDFVIKMNSLTRVFRNHESPNTAAAYSTTPDELVEIEKLERKYNSLTRALNQYVENKYVGETSMIMEEKERMLNEINHLIEKHGSIDAAIDKFMKKKYKNEDIA